MVLRHRPEAAGLELDPAGWVGVDALLAALAAHGRTLDRAGLERIVATNDKRRFALSEDGQRIRASQGHTVPVDLGYREVAMADVPEQLFHGTHPGALAAIRREGLRPMTRHDVHLSATRETAERVGARRGQPVVLTVASGEMARAGHAFRVSANGVWLTPTVPPRYLRTA